MGLVDFYFIDKFRLRPGKGPNYILYLFYSIHLVWPGYIFLCKENNYKI